jgi:glycerophosphoryl diester phosphodiesterase
MPLEAVPEEQRDFVQVLSVDRRLLLKDQVQRVQAEGKEVWAFTCNTQEEKETVRALGVNAFFTDNPQ